MAEIIVEPTALSKVIALKFKINDVDVPKTTQLPTNKQFNTTDTDAWFTFELDGLASINGTYDLTLINLDDKSIFHHADVIFPALPFHYKLNSSEDVTLNEIRHAGRWLGQLVVTMANGDTTARQFGFDIAGHILDGQDAQVILLSDYQALINTINLAKDDLAQYNVDYAALLVDIAAAEDARVTAYNQLLADQQANIEAFDVALDDGIVAANLAAKLQDFEATNNSRLLSAEQQLAETKKQTKSAYTWQNYGQVFDTNDPSLVDHDIHASWSYSHVHWDNDLNKVMFLYTIKPNHGTTNNRMMLCFKEIDGSFSAPKLVSDGRGVNESRRSMGSLILPNGDYLILMSILDNTLNTMIRTDLYRSTDKGDTWTVTSDVRADGYPIKGSYGDTCGLLRLRSGRLISMILEEFTLVDSVIYSDDEGLTWQWSNMTGAPVGHTEPVFIELTDGTILAYLREDLSTNYHLARPAMVMHSYDSGVTWTEPVYSTTILDYTQSNGAMIYDEETGLIEYIHHSRHKRADGYSSIFVSVATEEDAKADKWSEQVRIGRHNRADFITELGYNGDGGYIGACKSSDGVITAIYYNGTKHDARVCWLEGRKNTPPKQPEYTGSDANGIPRASDYAGGDLLFGKDPAQFEQGSFYSSAQSPTFGIGFVDAPSSTTTRLRSKGYVTVKPSAKYRLKVSSQHLIVVRQYDGNNILLAESGWQTDTLITTLSNAVKAKILVKKLDESVIIPSDIQTVTADIAENGVYVDSDVLKVKNSAGSTVIVEDLNQTDVMVLNPNLFEQGSFTGPIGSLETVTTSTVRLRSIAGIFDIPTNSIITIDGGANYSVVLRQYDSGNLLIAETGWTSYLQVALLDNVNKIKFIVKKNDESTIVPADIATSGIRVIAKKITNQIRTPLIRSNDALHNTLFVDRDGVLKFKNSAGVVKTVTLA